MNGPEPIGVPVRAFLLRAALDSTVEALDHVEGLYRSRSELLATARVPIEAAYNELCKARHGLADELARVEGSSDE